MHKINYQCFVEYGLNQEFDSLLDLDNKGILFLLGYCCLKLSSSIRSLVYYLIWNSFWNRSDSPCVCGKEIQVFLVLDMLVNLSLLYKQSAAAKKKCGCEKKRLSFVQFFDICGLQFEIVREVCCCLVLQFGDLLSLGTLQLLDLICGSLFGLCAIGIWYL